MREAAVELGQARGESITAAVDDLSSSPALRGTDLLNLVRFAFGLPMQADARTYVIEAFRKRGVEGDNQMQQLWSTLAGLVLIERFERGPGKRTAPRLAPDSIASVAVEVLCNRGWVPVHPDVAAYSRAWKDAVTDHLRLAGGPSKMPPIPEVLAVSSSESDDPEEAPAAADPAEQLAALANYVGPLADWLERSSAAGRLAGLQEQQDLLWWLQSGEDAGLEHELVDGDEDVSAEEPPETAAQQADPEAEAEAEAHVGIVLSVCEELISLTRLLPGPPAAEHLLSRRLGQLREMSVKKSTLAEQASRSVPAAVSDICAILSGDPGEDVEVTAHDAARQLYVELMLCDMAEALPK
jgi:hypothetical protein